MMPDVCWVRELVLGRPADECIREVRVESESKNSISVSLSSEFLLEEIAFDELGTEEEENGIR